MRSSTYVGLLAGAAVAQESVSVFLPYPYATALTYVGADATATTFTNSCPSGSGGFFPAATESEGQGTVTPAPSATGRPRVRRQEASSSDDLGLLTLCEPFTLIQGPYTYGLHLTDPVPDVWTMDLECSWKGATMTAAELTCTIAQSGALVDSSLSGTVTSTVDKDEVSSLGPFATLALVSAPTGSGSAAQPSGPSGTGAIAPSRSGSASPSASGASTSQSAGFAPAGPLPTGAVAFIGGAAGILAAALAL
ncbi:hypothetical protein ACN47E_002417 [Coniothyrium glycines]